MKINFINNLSIIIPIFNEEENIKNTLNDIKKYLDKKKTDAEIICVNDGSTDKSLKIITKQQKKIQNLKIINLKKNKGKGFAVKTGMLAAKKDYVLFMDADNSTKIQEIEKFKTSIKTGADIVIGSRALKSSIITKKQNFIRIFIGKFGNFLIQLFLIKGIKDTQCGFKLFKKEVSQKLFYQQKIDGWGFDVEILVLAKK